MFLLLELFGQAKLKKFESIKIVTPKEFLKILKRKTKKAKIST